MKERHLPITPTHTLNFIKLCYILIITVGMFGIKLFVFPESEYELLLAISIGTMLIESLTYSTLICTALSLVIFRMCKLGKTEKK